MFNSLCFLLNEVFQGFFKNVPSKNWKIIEIQTAIGYDRSVFFKPASFFQPLVSLPLVAVFFVPRFSDKVEWAEPLDQPRVLASLCTSALLVFLGPRSIASSTHCRKSRDFIFRLFRIHWAKRNCMVCECFFSFSEPITWVWLLSPSKFINSPFVSLSRTSLCVDFVVFRLGFGVNGKKAFL